ncbi:MAG: hypothetical protein PHT58_04350 [Eubacteriales bacterium]|nr:hypothetical protein [Eubacteriales bacterium]
MEAKSRNGWIVALSLILVMMLVVGVLVYVLFFFLPSVPKYTGAWMAEAVTDEVGDVYLSVWYDGTCELTSYGKRLSGRWQSDDEGIHIKVGDKEELYFLNDKNELVGEGTTFRKIASGSNMEAQGIVLPTATPTPTPIPTPTPEPIDELVGKWWFKGASYEGMDLMGTLDKEALDTLQACYISFFKDNTCEIVLGAELTGYGTWTHIGEKVAITIDGDIENAIIRDGLLIMERDGLEISFEKEN